MSNSNAGRTKIIEAIDITNNNIESIYTSFNTSISSISNNTITHKRNFDTDLNHLVVDRNTGRVRTLFIFRCSFLFCRITFLWYAWQHIYCAAIVSRLNTNAQKWETKSYIFQKKNLFFARRPLRVSRSLLIKCTKPGIHWWAESLVSIIAGLGCCCNSSNWTKKWFQRLQFIRMHKKYSAQPHRQYQQSAIDRL